MQTIDISQLSRTQFAYGLKKPGAFAWWYIDLSTADGDGLVLVWSLGLPFLPKSRSAQLPGARPSIHLATYRAGRPDIYLLTELSPDSVSADQTCGTGQWERSSFSVRSEPDGHMHLHIVLDLPVSHSAHRLHGTITLSGKALELSDATPESSHVWTPRVLHGEAAAELQWNGQERSLRGAGYFDGNFSSTPLHNQDIKNWNWGRISFPDHSLVYYQTTHPTETTHLTCLVQHESGAQAELSPSIQLQDARLGNFGIRAPRRLRLNTGGGSYDIQLRHLVDDGPFYQRFWLDADTVDQTGRRLRGHGIAEHVYPARVDQPWQRPFVRMKTHLQRGKNSPFLPLFSGFPEQRSDRFARAIFSEITRSFDEAPCP